MLTSGPHRARLFGLLVTAVVVTSAIRVPEAAPAFPSAPRANEYAVKAALIYNIAKFVTWPPAVFPAAGEPLVVCVVGADPFGSTLDDTLKGRQVGGRPVVVRRVAEPEPPCRVLFVSSSEHKRLGVILDKVKAGVLTVADMAGFNRAGGIIELVTEADSIHFHLNAQAAEQARLQISARLRALEARVHQHGATQ
jgi:hypothetical protein